MSDVFLKTLYAKAHEMESYEIEDTDPYESLMEVDGMGVLLDLVQDLLISAHRNDVLGRFAQRHVGRLPIELVEWASDALR